VFSPVLSHAFGEAVGDIETSPFFMQEMSCFSRGSAELTSLAYGDLADLFLSFLVPSPELKVVE